MQVHHQPSRLQMKTDDHAEAAKNNQAIKTRRYTKTIGWLFVLTVNSKTSQHTMNKGQKYTFT